LGRNINKIQFTDEYTAQIAAQLIYNDINMASSFESSTSGYVCGGSSYIEIQRLTFINETNTKISATLSGSNLMYYHSGCRSTKSGYSAGFQYRANVIQRLTFSNESNTVISATFSVSRMECGCSESSSSGYWVGGHDNPYIYRSIERLKFSDESDTIIGAVLSVTLYSSCGFGKNQDYIPPGPSGISKIMNIEISNISTICGTSKSDIKSILSVS
jgi:hypothetical protein